MVDEATKSEAMLGYESAEFELYQRWLSGEISIADYGQAAYETIQRFMPALSESELFSVARIGLMRHTEFANALAKQGRPQPGNDPLRPN